MNASGTSLAQFAGIYQYTAKGCKRLLTNGAYIVIHQPRLDRLLGSIKMDVPEKVRRV